MDLLYWIVTYICKFGLEILCRVDKRDEMRRVPAHGPLIVYANHTGNVEIPLIFAELAPRRPVGIAKVESWGVSAILKDSEGNQIVLSSSR